MKEFFTRLEKGDNIKAAFEFATEKTEAFTHKGGDANTTNRFYDGATQHPLLDDNGDAQGNNTLTAAATSDSHKAANILLGVGLNYDTNSAANPAEIISVSNTIYLSAAEAAATLKINVNNANHINVQISFNLDLPGFKNLAGLFAGTKLFWLTISILHRSIFANLLLFSVAVGMN